MVNQWEFEVFSCHHKQIIQREAEAGKLLKGIGEKTLGNNIHSRSIIAWLIEQLAGHEVWRQGDNREAAQGDRSFISI